MNTEIHITSIHIYRFHSIEHILFYELAQIGHSSIQSTNIVPNTKQIDTRWNTSAKRVINAQACAQPMQISVNYFSLFGIETPKRDKSDDTRPKEVTPNCRNHLQ
jgi:hypothetical protein